MKVNRMVDGKSTTLDCEILDWEIDEEGTYITFSSLLKKVRKAGLPIKSDKLEDLVINGYIPTYVFEEENSVERIARFRYDEVIEWIKRNLIHRHGGKDLPIILAINVKEKRVKRELPEELIYAKKYLVHMNPPVIYTGIYFLVRASKIVYIGQSVNIQTRVTEHLKDKIFDSIFVLPLSRDQLDRVESSLINYIEPEYNSMIPKKPNDYNEIIKEYLLPDDQHIESELSKCD